MPYAITSGRTYLEVAIAMSYKKWSLIDPSKPALGWRKGRETAVIKWEPDKFVVYAQAVASR
jgi:hypothetical protein